MYMQWPCICVCYNLVFYWNGWIDQAGYWLVQRLSSTNPTLSYMEFCCVIFYTAFCVSPKITVLLSVSIAQTQDLETFCYRTLTTASVVCSNDQCQFITLSIYPCVQHYGVTQHVSWMHPRQLRICYFAGHNHALPVFQPTVSNLKSTCLICDFAHLASALEVLRICAI